MFRYCAFGLQIDSELELPELAEGSGRSAAEPDLRILMGDIGRALPPPDSPPVFDYEDPHGVVMIWPQVGGFRINADMIEVEPAKIAGREYLAFPLLGPVMAWCLHLRGRMILHASALVWRGRAFGFLGDKMAGKSTTAAAFLREGAKLLTDDLLAFDMEDPALPQVQPAFAQLKLSEDSANAVRVAGAQALPLIMEGFPKRQHRLDRLAETPPSFDALFILERGGSAGAIEWLGDIDALKGLMRFSYNVRFHDAPLAMQERGRHFQHCTALARSVKVGRLHIPDDLERLPETVQRVGQALDIGA